MEAKTSRELAVAAREASLKLRVLPTAKRVELLNSIADALEQRKPAIMAKNAIDVENSKSKITDALMKRLQLKEVKLQSAVDGIRQIARTDEPIGHCIHQTRIMKGLLLEKIAEPIGVLLIIFEARPEALLQISALAIRSGNGLLLKGGKEAADSNKILHSIITDVINTVIPSVGSSLISLIEKREEVADLLKLDDVIDLVIPRGSNQLVGYIQQNTKISVLGHADGICHVYVDAEADISMAVQICIDSKTDYPAACNAVEKILIHESLLNNDVFSTICNALKSKDVHLNKGLHPSLADLTMDPAPSQKHEYSSMEVTIEVVNSLEDAVHHINTYGSGHTDTIVTENKEHAQMFCSSVDSSCVFHNASTRWSDGYRFGLGAEVGISTSRIHARGPVSQADLYDCRGECVVKVGVEGLMTTKYVLKGNGHLVQSDANKDAYLFKRIQTNAGCGLETKSIYFLAGVGTTLAFTMIYKSIVENGRF